MSELPLERSQLVSEVEELLQGTSFSVSSRCDIKSACFDLAARRLSDKILVLLKILLNIDSLQKLHAFELRVLANYLQAAPLLVGQRCRRHGQIPDGVVYERHGIPAVNPQTARNLLVEGLLPLVYAFRGGLYVKLNSERLRAVRETYNLSLRELAREVGVSRRTIYDYERGETDASLETAMRLGKILDPQVFSAIDVLRWEVKLEELEKAVFSESLEKEVYEQFKEIGLDPILLKTTPFDIFALDSSSPTPKQVFVNIMTAIHKGSEGQSTKRIRIVKDVATITHSGPLYVTDDDPVDVEPPLPVQQGVATMSIQELEKIKEVKVLIEEIQKKLRI